MLARGTAKAHRPDLMVMIHRCPAKHSLNVLFIGNSFRARNDLPGLIARLAAARGVSMEHRLNSVGGASLRTHRNKGDAQAAIQGEHYDYVVLQEQSTPPVKNATRMKANPSAVSDVTNYGGALLIEPGVTVRTGTGRAGDTLVGTATTEVGRFWSAIVYTPGPAVGTYTYLAQASGDVGLGGPSS